MDLSAKLLDISYSGHFLIKSKHAKRRYVSHILGIYPNDMYCIRCIQINILLMLTFGQRCYVFHIIMKILLIGKSNKRIVIS